MGVRGLVGAAPVAGRGAVGAGCAVGAVPDAAAGFVAGAVGRAAGAAFGGVASDVDGPDVRGATIGRATCPAPGAPPGIIGRGGNSIGRPAAGGAAGGCGLAVGAFSVTAGAAALVEGAGTRGGIAAGGGVGPFGTP